ncbi:hypothetical protein BH20CHL6_BH20CHL6_02470 [soil metagenome]
MGDDPGGVSDPDLVARVVHGDEAALAELYDRHANTVFLLAFRRLGDRGLAEEVMQETYLALWNRAELFDASRGSLAAWLATIARNRSVDRLRALGRRPMPIPLGSIIGDDDRDDRGLERALAAGQLLGAAPPAPEPEAVVDAEWLRSTVRDALATVPAPEQRVIEMAYYEGLTQVEISARLGWPLGTVKTRTRRGLGRLRTVLAEMLGPELGASLATTQAVAAPGPQPGASLSPSQAADPPSHAADGGARASPLPTSSRLHVADQPARERSQGGP